MKRYSSTYTIHCGSIELTQEHRLELMLKNWKLFNKNGIERSFRADGQHIDEQQTEEYQSGDQADEARPMSMSDKSIEIKSRTNNSDGDEHKDEIIKDPKMSHPLLIPNETTEENKEETLAAESDATAICDDDKFDKSSNMKDGRSSLHARRKRNSFSDMSLFRSVIKPDEQQRSLPRIFRQRGDEEHYMEEIKEKSEEDDEDENVDACGAVQDIDIDKTSKMDLSEQVICLKFEIAQCRGDLDQQFLLTRKLTEERIALSDLIESVTKERNELIKENENMIDEIAELQSNYFDGVQLQIQLEEVQEKLEISDAKNKELEESNKEQLETISNLEEKIEVITKERNELQECNKVLEQELDNHVAQDTLINELKGTLDKAITENDENFRRKVVLEEEQKDTTSEIIKLREETKANTTTISEVQTKLAQIGSERSSLASDYQLLKEEESRLINDLQRYKEENLWLIARLELLHTPSNPFRRKDENSDSFSFIPNLNSHAIGRRSVVYSKIEEGLSALI